MSSCTKISYCDSQIHFQLTTGILHGPRATRPAARPPRAECELPSARARACSAPGGARRLRAATARPRAATQAARQASSTTHSARTHTHSATVGSYTCHSLPNGQESGCQRSKTVGVTVKNGRNGRAKPTLQRPSKVHEQGGCCYASSGRT